jgi:N-acetylglutamate synthase/N-acetylornithine aminotransferase
VDGFGWSEAVRVPAETVRPTVEAACDDAVLVSVTIQAAAANAATDEDGVEQCHDAAAAPAELAHVSNSLFAVRADPASPVETCP